MADKKWIRLVAGPAVGTALIPAYVYLIRPRFVRWGASGNETVVSLPGDDIVPEPKMQSTRAVTVKAPAAKIWPWLVQIGQGRGGLYSYDWLENLAGCNVKTVDRILPSCRPWPSATRCGWVPKAIPSFAW
jgi:hypothetical protein